MAGYNHSDDILWEHPKDRLKLTKTLEITGEMMSMWHSLSTTLKLLPSDSLMRPLRTLMGQDSHGLIGKWANKGLYRVADFLHKVRSCENSCYPHDCSDVFHKQGLTSDGVYLIYPSGPNSPAVPVYCDMTSSGGPWTVFQKRFDGSVNFYRGWEEYKSGFGRADGEYWLGLQNIYLLTQNKLYRLRVDLEDFENEKRFVTYNEFYISPLAISAEEDRYKLHINGFQEGDPSKHTGNGLAFHNGMSFTTHDHDGDNRPFNCAQLYKGAYWYNACHSSNLNGEYLHGPTKVYANGIVWSSWKGANYSLKMSEMKISPVE
ncbi:microfibril-associated glycoprotein 4-like [Bombina bombina]|uniref:microfibril-associated glycoprotein 4-like n=1 Tax=Bombina bombina TaxID=8345 RepID=UPI00235A95DA|nr:microfibril-associated glycoprotein 4-like [Bombina bombina]